MSDKIKVVYIAGSVRSGSTLVGNLLGQIDGWTHAGEIMYFWNQEKIKHQICGCGQSIHDCAFWNSITRGISENSDFPDRSRMVQLRETLFRSRHLLLPSFPWSKRRDAKALGENLSNRARLYRSIRDVSGATVIVDSSKNPMQAYLVGLIDEIDTHIVHLVRDPRAVAYSCAARTIVQKKTLGISHPMKMKHVQATLMWTAWNYIIGKKVRPEANSYQLVRYEDFVRDPEGAIRGICDSIDERGFELPRIVDGQVNLRPTHTIWGNPSRLKTGPIVIREDNEWRRQLSVLEKIFVSCLSVKGLMEYKYNLICKYKELD